MVWAPACPTRPAASRAVAAMDVKYLVCFAIIYFLLECGNSVCFSKQALCRVLAVFFDLLAHYPSRLQSSYIWYVSIMCISYPASSFSAIRHVHGQAAARCFLVFGLHIRSGVPHRPDHLIEGDVVRPIAAQRQRGCIDGLDGAERVAFDAGNLHQPADRIAGHPEMMLHPNLRGILDLPAAAAQGRGQAGGCHGACHTYLPLASDFGARDRGMHLAQRADCRGGQEESPDTVL